MKIKKIWALEILDSRGFPTIKCNLLLSNGKKVSSCVPSGASVGQAEALELRDSAKKRYFGKGVLRAIENIEKKIFPILKDKEPDLFLMDKELVELDKTKNKSNLGANAILAVSMAVARAQAAAHNIQLYELINKLGNLSNYFIPKVMFNILNGGMHSDSGICFQEFMIMPLGNKSFSEKLNQVVMVYQKLKKLLEEHGYSVGVGDEGGFAPKLAKKNDSGEKKALDFLVKAVDCSGLKLGKDIAFCLDVAASQFYDKNNGLYYLKDRKLTAKEMINLYEDLISQYPINSIEDGLDEQDWQGWKEMTENLGSRVQLVGDDIFATNTKLIKKGIDNGIANAVLIKPNQIGTVSETIEAIGICKKNKYKTVVSHRSGETCDDFISDLAVGICSGQFKAGACARGERVAKYNRLLEIEFNINK
ncbi:phosphopyruvate hydratase [Candidatus Dependentiae bacterium]